MTGPAQTRIDALTPTLGRIDDADDAFHWQRAYDDALRALRSLPDPAEFALWLEEWHREGLRTAWRSREGWRVDPRYVRAFRLLGLVEVSGDPQSPGAHAEQRNYLTDFGIKVRRVILAAEVLS